MKRSFFYKIFFSYLVIICLSFFILDLLIKDEIKKTLTSKIEEELLAYAELVDLRPVREISNQLIEIASISNSRVTLIDETGKVIADSEKDINQLDNHLNRPEIQESRVRGYGKSIRFSNSLNVEMLYVAIPIKVDSKIRGYIRLARPLLDVQNFIEKVYQSIFVTIILLAIISLIVALFISFRLAAPIRAIEKFTQRLRQGKPTGTIILYTSDETKKLADNINYLVDELKNKIKLANEEKSKLMTAFTSINEGVLILDAVDKIEFVSPALSNMLAAQYGDISGKTLMEAFRNIELEKSFHEFKESRQTVSREITLGSVEPVILSVSISAVQDHPGEEKIMVVFHDVTRLKKLEMIRTDFVANVTHEIKTPLTAIIGYLETIKDGAINNIDETKRFIEIILKQAQRLNRLVEDLMTISKIELNETRFNFENLFLSDAVTNVISIVEKKATSKKIPIENYMPEKLRMVRADRDRLTQILVNVLDNAIKFTPESGNITITEDEANGYIVVSIMDTGIGVPGDEIQRLGERFYRVDKTRSRDLGGTGLGLSIVKHLMIAHGGKMEIESQLGRGTKVSLFFPLHKV